MARIKALTPLPVALTLAALGGVASAAPPLVDAIQLQVHQHQAGGRDTHLTLHAGRPPFQIRPTSGYPGQQVSLSIASYYEIFEKGVRKEKVIRRAVIDWGDGTSPTAVPGGQVARHTYGSRQSNGAVSPTKNRDFLGKVTLHLEGGDVVTEHFRYMLWVDKPTLRTGGRHLPHEQQERVWCAGGSREGPYCVETFEIQQTVFSFEGCFDHNYVEFPVANAPAATFDVRSTARVVGGRYNQGWRADQVANEIAAAYAGHFRVNNGDGVSNGGIDNMSGIYYHFNPIQLDQLSVEWGQSIEQLVIDSATATITRFSTSYTNELRGRSVTRQPSAGNGWIARVVLDNKGDAGGSPPCPKGVLRSKLGWVKMDISARISGRIFSLPTVGNDKLPSGFFDQEKYRAD